MIGTMLERMTIKLALQVNFVYVLPQNYEEKKKKRSKKNKLINKFG